MTLISETFPPNEIKSHRALSVDTGELSTQRGLSQWLSGRWACGERKGAEGEGLGPWVNVPWGVTLEKKTHIEETSPFFQVVCILVMCLNGRGDFFRAQHRLGNFLADYLPRERPLWPGCNNHHKTYHVSISTYQTLVHSISFNSQLFILATIISPFYR